MELNTLAELTYSELRKHAAYSSGRNRRGFSTSQCIRPHMRLGLHAVPRLKMTILCPGRTAMQAVNSNDERILYSAVR